MSDADVQPRTSNTAQPNLTQDGSEQGSLQELVDCCSLGSDVEAGVSLEYSDVTVDIRSMQNDRNVQGKTRLRQKSALFCRVRCDVSLYRLL